MTNTEIYTVILGKYSDKYMVTAEVGKQGAILTRCSIPKSKIDAVRLPLTIHISFYGFNVPSKTQ